MFRGLVLSRPIKPHAAVFTGATLKDDLPCQLLHKITVCKSVPVFTENGVSRNISVTPRHDFDKLANRLLTIRAPITPLVLRGEFCLLPRENEIVLSEEELATRLTRVPRRHPWQRISDVYNHLIDERQEFPQSPVLAAPPNIIPSEKPKMPFISSDLKASGPIQGLVFKRKKDPKGTGTVWLIAESKKQPEKAARRMWHAKAEHAMLKLLSADQLLCVKCGENAVYRFGAGFVLCETCETAPAVAEPHFDFYKLIALASDTRKDGGFQDEENYKRTQPQHLSVSLAEMYGQSDRPLLDYELALILAVKYPKFTQRNTLSYLKAQRAAAQLSARFLFKRSFAEITRLVPHTKENAVRMYCERAHADFAKYLRDCRGKFPEEARFALRSRMLDSLYAPALIQGHRCHSKTCCTA